MKERKYREKSTVFKALQYTGENKEEFVELLSSVDNAVKVEEKTILVVEPWSKHFELNKGDWLLIDKDGLRCRSNKAFTEQYEEDESFAEAHHLYIANERVNLLRAERIQLQAEMTELEKELGEEVACAVCGWKFYEGKTDECPRCVKRERDELKRKQLSFSSMSREYQLRNEELEKNIEEIAKDRDELHSNFGLERIRAEQAEQERDKLRREVYGKKVVEPGSLEEDNVCAAEERITAIEKRLDEFEKP